MNWREHIYSNPGIYGGKPIFRDTRISVEMVLDLMAAGWTLQQMQDEYPGIVAVHIPASASFAAEMIHDENSIATSRARAA
jgi:uncharacterized protein (DUF433 family)